MKYKIERMSDVKGKNKPCKDAYEVGLIGNERCWAIELRSLKDLDKITEETGFPLLIAYSTIKICDDDRMKIKL